MSHWIMTWENSENYFTHQYKKNFAVKSTSTSIKKEFKYIKSMLKY